MKAPSTAINRFRCQALDADEEGSVQATRVPPELNQTVHTVAAVGIGVDVLGAGCQNGSGVVPPCRRGRNLGSSFLGTISYPCGKVGNSPFTVDGRAATRRPSW
jgi:hypothetical protein